MATLDLDSISNDGSLKLNEVVQRLKKNPSDVQARRALAKIKSASEKLSKKLEPMTKDLLDTPVNVIFFAKKISTPEIFPKVTISNGLNLFGRLPIQNAKYKIQRRIAKLFLNNLKVNKFKILKVIDRTKYGNLKRRDFDKNPRKYDQELRNHLKGFKKNINRLRFRFKFSKTDIEAVPLTKMP